MDENNEVMDLEGEKCDLTGVPFEDFEIPDVEPTDEKCDPEDNELDDILSEDERNGLLEMYDNIPTDGIELSEKGKRKIATVLKYITRVFVPEYTGLEVYPITVDKRLHTVDISITVDCVDLDKIELSQFIKLMSYVDGFSMNTLAGTERIKITFGLT